MSRYPAVSPYSSFFMKRYKFVIGSIVIAAGLVYLFSAGVRESAARHMTLSMLESTDDSQFNGRRIQLGGCSVVKGSIRWDEYRHRPEFTVRDGEHTLRVRYSGNAILPDTFKDQAPVVMEGRFLPHQRLFDADIIFAKCPSKYEGQSYVGHVEAMGEAL